MRENPSTDPESPVRDPARDYHNGWTVLIVFAFGFAYLQILKQFLVQSMNVRQQSIDVFGKNADLYLVTHLECSRSENPIGF